MSLPWTKFQDFYLRLGFLKVLVAVLNKERSSAANELVTRRLMTPLFGGSRMVPRSARSVEPADDTAKQIQRGTTVIEQLLVDGKCPSLLYAVTKPTAIKILDWGRNVGLVGRGNQITERGLLLRRLLPAEEVEAFLIGDPKAWNPFVLTTREKVFFLYHLCEIDRVTADLVVALGALPDGRVLELRDAGRMVTRILHSVLDAVERGVKSAELPVFRIARELAATMAEEMDLSDLVAAHGTNRAKLRPGTRALVAAQTHSNRKLTKNTDHQTVPRFEQLADLGFVRKEGPGFPDDPEPRKRWRWSATAQSRVWKEVLEGRAPDAHLLRSGFGRAAANCWGTLSSALPLSPVEIARRTWAAYLMVRRPVGHTPLETVALAAMLGGVVDGCGLEMDHVHDLMLILKRSSVLPDQVQFAGGNGIDEMFVRMRQGFPDAVDAALGDAHTTAATRS